MLPKPDALNALRDRFADVRTRIETAAQACDRSPDEITLVAITKTHPAETLKAALALGLRDLGENRVQEAEEKIHMFIKSVNENNQDILKLIN